MARVKICGLTREVDVASAVEAEADAVGFINGFPESPRNVSLVRAGQLIAKVPPFVDAVLVTTAEVVRRGEARIMDIRPSALQLYGRVLDPARLRGRLGLKLFLPHLMAKGGDGKVDATGFDAVLSDTYRKGRSGGTGEASDWDLCKRLRDVVAPVPFILSGGLTPANVQEAIARVDPFAVDVSSGVEASPGIKDRAKIRAFVRNATGSR